MATVFLAPPSPEEVLSTSPMPELRRLEVATDTDTVVITGRVSSFYLKQLAQEAVKPVAGSRKIDNRVVVAR